MIAKRYDATEEIATYEPRFQRMGTHLAVLKWTVGKILPLLL